MPTVKLTDGQAKTALRTWPKRTKTWPVPAHSGYWVRASPSTRSMPYVHPAGATILKTKPDGLYLFAHVPSRFCDVIAVEHCGNVQNFNDKRSRYTPTSGNVHVTIPLDWLNKKLTKKKSYWQASCWFSSAPKSDITLTIRHLRVLFALTDKDYTSFGQNHLPGAHEYFCRHRDLTQITQQGMQEFIKSMALMKHFRVEP
jgi:hypothetical protein